jgi:hypothetical protein
MWPHSHSCPGRLSLALGATVVGGLAMAAWSKAALAHRPFDGTDAAVAAEKEMEIELQPEKAPFPD